MSDPKPQRVFPRSKHPDQLLLVIRCSGRESVLPSPRGVRKPVLPLPPKGGIPVRWG
jgi:hypothetical protein